MSFKQNNVLQLIDIIKNIPQDQSGTPLKKAFNPMLLPRMMPFYILGRMHKPGSVKVLLSGEQINNVYDSPLKGLDLFDILSPHEKKFVSQMHVQMFKKPCGVFTTRQLQKETGAIMSLATYSFPLISNDGKEKYFLMYYENRGINDDHDPISGKISSLSPYTSLEFIDIGNGTPDADFYLEELSALSGT